MKNMNQEVVCVCVHLLHSIFSMSTYLESLKKAILVTFSIYKSGLKSSHGMYVAK